MWSRGCSQFSISTAPFFTMCCCDRVFPHISPLHFQTLQAQWAALHMDEHLIICGVQCQAAWKFSSNIICLLEKSCQKSMLLGNNGGSTRCLLWSTLVLPRFITIDNPSQEVSHCNFMCSQLKLTLLQSLNCFSRISWQLSTEILTFSPQASQQLSNNQRTKHPATVLQCHSSSALLTS
jgi:hypothetical protein